jgi:hypothetical protein
VKPEDILNNMGRFLKSDINEEHMIKLLRAGFVSGVEEKGLSSVLLAVCEKKCEFHAKAWSAISQAVGKPDPKPTHFVSAVIGAMDIAEMDDLITDTPLLPSYLGTVTGMCLVQECVTIADVVKILGKIRGTYLTMFVKGFVESGVSKKQFDDLASSTSDANIRQKIIDAQKQ